MKSHEVTISCRERLARVGYFISEVLRDFMRMASKSIDFEKVKTVIYHLPDGKALVIPAEIVEHSLDMELGSVCDISEINGVLHFYPKGHA